MSDETENREGGTHGRGIPYVKFEAVALERGLVAETLRQFHSFRVGGRAVYLSRRARVGRCDLSGFVFDHPAVVPLAEGEARRKRLGRVRAKLDFSRPEDEVLDAFARALDAMLLLREMEGAALASVCSPAPAVLAAVGARRPVAPPRAQTDPWGEVARATTPPPGRQ